MMRIRSIGFSPGLAGLLVFLIACAPSPKYRSAGRKASPVSATTKPPTRVRKETVSLIYPLNRFRISRITSLYGIRRHVSYGTRDFHTGIDIDANVGDEVIAAASGKIIFSGNQGGYGKVLIIEHPEGLCTVYAHLSSFAVESGTDVLQGQMIGRVGITGNSTGSHLHFEVRIGGKTVDPMEYLPDSR